MYRMANYDEPLLNEMEERKICKEEQIPLPDKIKRSDLDLPSLSERSVVKHFIHLSQMNYGVDTGVYPLGSCTMKYNPKILEEVARTDKVEHLHPRQHESTLQGSLEIIYKLERALCNITGMDAFSLQPAAGAHGELTGMLIARAYHENNGETRREVVIPDSAHGTNPASARMAGFDVVEIPSREGRVDMDALREVLSGNTAAFMLTNPNTLGIFEKGILEISREVKEVGALLYYDGANMNAIMGKARPGDMGFDIVHLNLHKTFATPHGGGGPGSGPVGVKSHLEKFLPVPRVTKEDTHPEMYRLDYECSHSIGKVSHFYGNFPVLLRAYTYIMVKGSDGLKESTERAVLNSNYLMTKLVGKKYVLPFGGRRMHEFVISAKNLKGRGIRALDVAKRLLDYGVHPPTIYFPMIVEEAMMIEPTESESRETLDRYAEIMNEIAEEDADVMRNAPSNAPIKRIDEARAARNPALKWSDF